MFKYDVKDYVKVYDKCFSESFCNDAIEHLNQKTWTQHTMSDYNGKKYTDDTELSTLYDDDNIYTKQIFSVIRKAVGKYVLEDFKDYALWFNGWNNTSLPRYNRYDVDTQMKVHCDHIHTLFDGNERGVPVLSILGALNNNYSGGEFIMFEDVSIKLKAGQIIIFPSNFMYPHRVLPVTAGIRHTFVSWAW